jgi:transposase
MKKTTRRKYTDEFKDEAVKLVTEQRYKITEAARSLDIHDSLLRRWIKRLVSGRQGGLARIRQITDRT